MNEPKNPFWDEIRRLHRDAAMNARRDEYVAWRMDALNTYTPPKPRTNAIGIPLIKWTGRFDA